MNKKVEKKQKNCDNYTESAKVEVRMKTEQMINGMACVRAMIEPFAETMPVQTENQLKCIDEVISRLKSIDALSDDIKAVNRNDMDEKTLVGFNMAVTLFNKFLGEER